MSAITLAPDVIRSNYGNESPMNIAKLKRLAPKGLKAGYMATELGVHPQTVRTALKRHGLHREWSLARYQKCGKEKS